MLQTVKTNYCLESENSAKPEVRGENREDDENNAEIDIRCPAQVLQLHGVRVFAAAAVVIHHLGALDRDLQSSNRRLETSLPQFVTYIADVGPGHIAVQTFLAMAGFVAAYPIWRQNKQAQLYDKVLLKRWFRLALPLIPVQLVNLLLYKVNLAYGNYGTRPAEDEVYSSLLAGMFTGVYSSTLNGALWVIELFFLAPFVSACVQIPALSLRIKKRALWYTGCVFYSIGNLHDESTISDFLAVILGVICADAFYHTSKHNLEFEHKTEFLLCFSLLILMGFPFFPEPLKGQKICIVLSGCAFLVIALFIKRIQCIFSNAFTFKTSKYTYELYIWHLVIFNTFGYSITPAFEYPTRIWVFFVAPVLALSISFIAYWLFEVPSKHLTDVVVRFFFAEPQL